MKIKAISLLVALSSVVALTYSSLIPGVVIGKDYLVPDVAACKISPDSIDCEKEIGG